MNAGNATVTITGKGNYIGTISKTFMINNTFTIRMLFYNVSI